MIKTVLHETIIRRCYELAINAGKKGFDTFGAVLVHDGKILEEAENTDDYEKKIAENHKLGYEYQLLHMSQTVSPVYVLCEEGLAWYEIDDEQDLEYAEKNIIKRI